MIRELLALQRGPVSVEKQPIKNKSEKELSDDNGKALPSQTPKWMKNVCGQLLFKRLMKPNGVKTVLLAFLEGSAGIKGKGV